MAINRGEVWLVDLDPTEGDEMQKRRPAVIVSTDTARGLKLRIIVPLTSWSPAFTGLPWLVRIEATTQNGLTKTSAANTFQVRSLSVTRFGRQLGELEEQDLAEVIDALKEVIGA